MAGPILAALPWTAIVVYLGMRSQRIEMVPRPVLANRARRIAAGERVSIPYQDRESEVGDLARALREWQEASAQRQVLLRSAPVGIFGLDAQGLVRDANRAAQNTLGYTREEMEGSNLTELLHPDDLHTVATVATELQEGADRALTEARLRRKDGSWQWCSTVIAPVRGEEESGGFVVIVEDIGERKRQAEWAAAVQREMLPGRVPELEGYEVAGSFRPAQEVAGDLYDWVESEGISAPTTSTP